jgi:putative membrane protein
MDDHNNSRSQQHLANQRTFLAWLRTCVALIGLGFVVSRFGLFLTTIFVGENPSVASTVTNPAVAYESSAHFSSLIGTSMVVLGIVFTVFALRNYLYTYRSIQHGSYSPKHFDIYLLSISLVILGAIIVAYLIVIPFVISQ